MLDKVKVLLGEFTCQKSIKLSKNVLLLTIILELVSYNFQQIELKSTQ